LRHQLEPPVLSKLIHVAVDSLEQLEPSRRNTFVPAPWVPAVFDAEVVQEVVPWYLASLSIEEKKQRKQPLVWRLRPEETGKSSPAIQLANCFNHPNVLYAAAVDANRWREQDHITDCCFNEARLRLWRHSPAVKASLGKSGVEFLVVRKVLAFSALRKAGYDLFKRTSPLHREVDVYHIPMPDMHDEAVHTSDAR